MSYSVEVREATRGGADYTENHFEFNTSDEVKSFIKNDMHEDEHVHSVLLYAEGQTSDPKDVTHQFTTHKRSSKFYR
jgi:hypothetical protein